MDKITLVERDIEDARTLVDLLIQKGLPVQMAAWVRREATAPFMLLIASPNIQKFGPLVGYKLLMGTLRSSKLALRLDDITLTNTTGMTAGANASFSYVFPVSGLHDEVFVFRATNRVRATAAAPSADAA